MNSLLFVFILLALPSTATAQQPPMAGVINSALKSAEEQTLLLAASLAEKDSLLPKSYEKGVLKTSDSRWWCSGFFPGVLWYLYENNRDPRLLTYARQYTSRIEREKYTTNNHDVGFMLYCSFGNGFRLTGDPSYIEVLTTGARSLCTRYNPNVKAIKSWDFNKKVWQYPVIIDNMMNLELLMWSAKQTQDDMFATIATNHADKTMKYHYRPDMSCYHVVSYDTLTAQPHARNTHQGFSHESAWARGQAWGLYGYTMMYRETSRREYLEMAEKIAQFLIHHPNMPSDYIPYWDFNAPDIPNTFRDASAGAIMASALIELSQQVDKARSAEYLRVAEVQLRMLASSQYTASPGEIGGFILKHSVGSLPHKGEVDVPLTYADYYYIEALLRYKKLITQS